MNYRHLYHAGNAHDVLKHVVLLEVLAGLTKKDTPLICLETHSGTGRYDLNSEEARKTNESVAGIQAVWRARKDLPQLARYFAALDRAAVVGGDGLISSYPGSPLLARELLRPQDRQVLYELHPADFSSLKSACKGFARCSVLNQDGYSAFRAYLPPPENRGVVVIDPPYERKDEFSALTAALAGALQRWPNGCYFLWFPLKDRHLVEEFYRGWQAAIGRKTLLIEMSLYADLDPELLNGSGVLIVNPPWQLDDHLAGEILPPLHRVLRQEDRAGFRVEFLVQERVSTQLKG